MTYWILDTLSIFENDNDAETSLAAKSLLGSLQTKKFVTLLVFFGRLYEYSEFGTKVFQKSTETVSSCLILLTELRERLVNYEFYKVVENAKEFSDKYAIENFYVRGTIRKRSRIILLYQVNFSKIFISALALPEILLAPPEFPF